MYRMPMVFPYPCALPEYNAALLAQEAFPRYVYMKPGGDTDGIILYRDRDDQGSVPLSQFLVTLQLLLLDHLPLHGTGKSAAG